MGYDRETVLKEKLNSFLINELGVPERDYCEALDLNRLLIFKSVLSDINNLITLKLCQSFIQWLAERTQMTAPQVEALGRTLHGTKPNSTGYDLKMTDPFKLLAEVKCNIPISGKEAYGASQSMGIFRDLQGLAEGKGKLTSTQEYYKFMVFLDRPAIRCATHALLKEKWGDRIDYVSEQTEFSDKNKIYIVFIDLI